MTTVEGLSEDVFSVRPAPRLYNEDSRRAAVRVVSSSVESSGVTELVGERVQLSVKSQLVKRRLGDWCEMATSLGPS
jgi:hypothetical protein